MLRGKTPDEINVVTKMWRVLSADWLFFIESDDFSVEVLVEDHGCDG